MPEARRQNADSVRAADLIASLCLATDLAMGFPFEHGLHATLVAMELADRLGVDAATASETYYASLLTYAGCTADAEVAANVFGDEIHRHFTPVMFGSSLEVMAGIARAIPRPGTPSPVRVARIVRGMPRAARAMEHHLVSICEVGEMLAGRLGLAPSVQRLFAVLTERWDGRSRLRRASGEQVPLALRIAHVARDAVFQRALHGEERAVAIVRARAGHAFDPAVVECFAADAPAIFRAAPSSGSAWHETLAREPEPVAVVEGDAVDRALHALADFSDLVSPYFAGHSSGVAALAEAAASRCGLDPVDVTAVRRAALVHDIGRVAVPATIWHKPGALDADEWEHVRLHAYHSDRALSRSAFLAGLAPIASSHHERLDGSGYHRGTTASTATVPANLLAAADAYHAMTEPRPHRDALEAAEAARAMTLEVRAGRLDADAVAAVLDAAGQPVPPLERPAGLTEREAHVIGLLARGHQTKQIARALGISSKTADRHIQNAYAKIGVSTRAAAALFAMEHGLATWGELLMSSSGRRP